MMKFDDIKCHGLNQSIRQSMTFFSRRIKLLTDQNDVQKNRIYLSRRNTQKSSLALDFFKFLIPVCVFEKRKYYFFTSFTLLFSSIYTIEYRTQTNSKKSSEKELRHFDFYRAGVIIFPLLAQ